MLATTENIELSRCCSTVSLSRPCRSLESRDPQGNRNQLRVSQPSATNEFPRLYSTPSHKSILIPTLIPQHKNQRNRYLLIVLRV